MESELETLQEERATLKTEVETQRKACSGMEQQMETITAEVSSNEVCTPSTVSRLLFLLVQVTQLRWELVSCSEERDDLRQSLEQWRSKVEGLEKTNRETRDLISILEDDVRTERRENKTFKTSLEKLASEKQQVHAAKHLNTSRIRGLS